MTFISEFMSTPNIVLNFIEHEKIYNLMSLVSSPGPEFIKHFISCSTQTLKFQLLLSLELNTITKPLINIKIIGILTFMSRIKFSLSRVEHGKAL